jgi:hypothetical protein
MTIQKKNNFLLLEILIAISLISICSIPLSRIPLSFLRNELKTLETIECERIAENTFCEISQNLLKEKQPWNKIVNEQKKANLIKLKPLELCIDNFYTKEVKRYCKLWKKEKTTPTGTYRLIKIRIFLFPKGWKKPIKYFYLFPMKKKAAT